jgi:integrase
VGSPVPVGRAGRPRTPAAADTCPRTGRVRLSYERAEYLFKQATKSLHPRRGGYTLHQLRHSRLTHLGEDGWSAPMLMALSGHENLRTLGIYVNPGTEAVAAQARRAAAKTTGRGTKKAPVTEAEQRTDDRPAGIPSPLRRDWRP